jgi:hypothetical protein
MAGENHQIDSSTTATTTTTIATMIGVDISLLLGLPG